MRGSDVGSGSLFSYVDIEQQVPARHPLRVIKAIADDVLMALDASSGFTKAPAARRLRRNCYCEPRCCRRSIRCASSGN